MSKENHSSICEKTWSQEFEVTRRSLLKIGMSSLGMMAMPGLSFAALCSSSLTPRQTRGPYFPYDHVVSYPIREEESKQLSLIEANDHDLTQIKGVRGIARGPIIYFHGQVLQQSLTAGRQKECQPVAGAMVLLWQANHSGRYNHYQDNEAPLRFRHPKTGVMIHRVYDDRFQYWGKTTTDPNGQFQFKTILPGFYPATSNWFRPPHLHFSIRAKGRPEFVTQTYFSGVELPEIDLIHELNAKDRILHDSRILSKQRADVIVDYQRGSSGKFQDGFVGTCRFIIP